MLPGVLPRREPVQAAGGSFRILFHSAIFALRSALVSLLFLSTLPPSRWPSLLRAPVTHNYGIIRSTAEISRAGEVQMTKTPLRLAMSDGW